MNTPVTRNPRSRGRKAGVALEQLQREDEVLVEEELVAAAEVVGAAGSLALTPLAVGTRRASKSVSEIADRFMKMFWPKIG